MPTLAELHRLVGGELHGDENVEIKGVASLEGAGPRDIAPLESDDWVKVARQSKAGALLVSPKVGAKLDRPVIVTPFTLGALNRVMEALGLITPLPPPGVHPTALLDEHAEIGADVSIGPYCVIGAARIGDRCVLQAGVVVESGVEMGDDCVLHPGAVLHEGALLGNRVRIGAHSVVSRQGFGYAPTPQGPVKLHHLGRVVLEDDVHLGAGTMVDRARFDETRIGAFSALDNLVHVGHNCEIGKRSFVAAQTGLAGNARIGDDCEIGGQVGISNRSGVGDKCRVGAQSGVIRMFPDGTDVFGYPAAEKGEYLRQQAALRRLTRKRR